MKNDIHHSPAPKDHHGPHDHPTPDSHHDHKHSHFHNPTDLNGQKLIWAVFINVLLTLAQITGGILSGSLALLADALHNLSDAGALALAAFARHIAGRPASPKMTFGFGRAEILGALVSSTSLIVVALYIMYESIERFAHPHSIQGQWVIGVASIALIIDLLTAFWTYQGSKNNLNIRAAFLHNLSDALASVVVIISGCLILLFQIYWVDIVATMLISIYILYHSYHIIRECLSILMQAVPQDVSLEEVKTQLKSIPSIIEVHHIHIWQLHERFRSLEAHLVISMTNLEDLEKIKKEAKKILKDQFHISHSTLEFELTSSTPCEDCEPTQ